MYNDVNAEIREAAKQAGVRLWRVADRLGINDGNFSRKLRRELKPDEKAMVLKIIRELEKEGS